MAYTGRGQKYSDSNNDYTAIAVWVLNIALAFGSRYVANYYGGLQEDMTAYYQEAEQKLEDLETRIGEADALILDLQAQIEAAEK